MMMLVTFQLADDNPGFVEGLKALGNWSNRIDGAWVLESSLTPRQVRDNLASHMKPEDRLFVARLSGTWSGRGMGNGFPEWMERRDFGTGSKPVVTSSEA